MPDRTLQAEPESRINTRKILRALFIEHYQLSNGALEWQIFFDQRGVFILFVVKPPLSTNVGLAMRIEPLNLELHRRIIEDLEPFWLSGAEKMKMSHAMFFPMYFSGYSLVALENETVISYLYAIQIESHCFLHLICTRKGYHKKGYARTLVESLEVILLKQRIYRIEALRVKENILAEKFFHKQGFVENDRFSDIPGYIALAKELGLGNRLFGP